MKKEKTASARQLPGRPQKRAFLLLLHRERHAVAALLLAAAVLAVVCGSLYSDRSQLFRPVKSGLEGMTYESAEVLAVLSDTVETDPYELEHVEKGRQVLRIRLTSGAFAGTECEMENNVSLWSHEAHRAGDRLIVLQNAVKNETTGKLELSSVDFYFPDRTVPLLIVFAAFLLITVLVGGKTGAKSLLGLALTVAVIIWVMCPALMKGANPVAAAFLLCSFVAVVCFVILGGLHKKTVSAIAGTVAGMLLAALFGALAQRLCSVDSYSLYYTSNEIETFPQMQLTGMQIRVQGMLTAGIIISSLGAVMDVAMSLSSSISELKTVNPDMKKKDLWKSGMRIGRDMVGTMTNTLILAFVGSGLVLIVWLWSLDMSFNQLFSSDYFAVEVISGVSSSVGVILAVPLTALIASVFFGSELKNPVKAAGTAGFVISAAALAAGLAAVIALGRISGGLNGAHAGDIASITWVQSDACARTQNAAGTLAYCGIFAAAAAVPFCLEGALRKRKTEKARLPYAGLVLCALAAAACVIVFLRAPVLAEGVADCIR